MAQIVSMVGPKTPLRKTEVTDISQNIKVFVRCRPLKANEKKNIIEVLSDRKEVRINESKNCNEKYNSKTFTFDNTFAADTTQLQVYQAVVEPLIEQVMMGYNCTVFAYGQTGTGKTYTMEGERSTGDDVYSWAEDPSAGIIPRALDQLFDSLSIESSEHTVRVSFLELYNEELYDLLSPIDDTTKLKIFEDSSRKGSIIVSGLEEITVHSKGEIYEILRKGSSKRQTAATLLNACSSRSHTIFSVTVHIKENAIDGEDLVKMGKLNLVDLAGSENIGRSGAIDKRAREAGNINQSLLTLGRVITCLVDRTPHIPYRESKLTRLLQESLGGRTKTSIIATISPNINDSDDTLSTLEYAQRAKKITNKPEINQKLSKKTLLREYTSEIERLRRDLAACRERNGIYINKENYDQMEEQLKEQTEKIQILTEEMLKIQQLFDEMKEELDSKTEELVVKNEKVIKTSKELSQTEYNLLSTQRDRNEQKHLLELHLKTEKELFTQANQLLNVAEVTTSDVQKLHDKVNRQKKVETNNWEKTNEFQEKFLNDMNQLEELVSITTTSYNDSLDEMQSAIIEKISCVEDIVIGAQNKVFSLTKSLNEHKIRLFFIFSNDGNVLNDSHVLKDNTNKLHSNIGQTFNEILSEVSETQNLINKVIEDLNQTVCQQRQELEELLMKGNSHMKTQSKLTISSFNAIKTQLKSIFENQNLEFAAIVKQMEASKEVNSDSQKIIDKELDELEKSLESQMNKLIDIKGKRIKERTESQKTNTELVVKLKDKINTGMRPLNEMNEKVDGFVNEIKSEEKIGFKYIESIDTLNTGITEQLIEQTNGINGKNSLFPNQTKELIIAQKEVLTKQLLESDKLMNDYIKTGEKLLNEKQTTLKTLDEIQTEGLEEQNNSLLIIENNLEVMSNCVRDKTSEMVELSQTMERSQIRELDNRSKSFEVFVKNDLKKDISTGNTPKKTEYVYPKVLVETSPHQKILKRLRLKDINDAINTPLPDEYDSDSSISLKSYSSNDENITPLTDAQKQTKFGLKFKHKSNSESELKYNLGKDTLKRSLIPKPLSDNLNN